MKPSILAQTDFCRQLSQFESNKLPSQYSLPSTTYRYKTCKRSTETSEILYEKMLKATQSRFFSLCICSKIILQPKNLWSTKLRSAKVNYRIQNLPELDPVSKCLTRYRQQLIYSSTWLELLASGVNLTKRLSDSVIIIWFQQTLLLYPRISPQIHTSPRKKKS